MKMRHPCVSQLISMPMLGILEVLKCGAKFLRLYSQYQGVRDVWCPSSKNSFSTLWHKENQNGFNFSQSHLQLAKTTLFQATHQD